MKKIFSLLIIITLSIDTFAQVSNYVSDVKIGNAKERSSIAINAELFNVENISQISIAYKPFGETQFKNVEMLIAGNSSSGNIPAEDVIPPYIEYYLLIELKDGSKQTYPVGIEQGVSPLQISIAGKTLRDKEIIILSPEEGEMFSENELLISISFVRASENVDINKTKIFLNNVDITASAIFDQDLITITSNELKEKFSDNSRLLEVQVFDKDGNLYYSTKKTFQVVSQQIAKSVEEQFKYSGSLKAEARNENTNSNEIFYKNIGADFNSSYKDWKINANAYLTSEEKDNLQPYNRYTLSIQNGDWLSLKVGDAYPRFPNLIVDGKRVRGVTGAINFGFFNIQTTYGEIVRSVEGRLIEKYNADNVPLASDVISINQAKYNAPFGKVNFGIYKRKLFAVRPSFGSGENFQLGFSYLHGIDDINSIEFGTRPKENVVVGSDLTLAFDNKNILFTSQAAFSLINKDISTGTLSDAQIDSIFTSNKDLNVDPADVKNIRDMIDKFITVNQYLGPWNPQKLSSLGAETALNLNYFNNSIRASYIYRGNEYQSFGQSYLRTDVKGINLVDRIRMLDNKLFISFGYESLQDNLQNTKLSTTNYTTLSASVSYFPRTNFPNITIGYNKFSNKNDLNTKDFQYGKYAIDDVTNRIFVQLSYDVYALVKHSTSFSFTTSSRDDNSQQNSDSKFTNVSLNVNSFWNRDLSSVLGLVYNTSEIVGYPFDYFSIYVGAKYLMLEDKLTLSGTISPSFGDFQRQSFEFVANYLIMQNFSVAFQTRIYRLPGKSTNSVIGFSTRYNI